MRKSDGDVDTNAAFRFTGNGTDFNVVFVDAHHMCQLQIFQMEAMTGRSKGTLSHAKDVTHLFDKDSTSCKGASLSSSSSSSNPK